MQLSISASNSNPWLAHASYIERRSLFSTPFQNQNPEPKKGKIQDKFSSSPSSSSSSTITRFWFVRMMGTNGEKKLTRSVLFALLCFLAVQPMMARDGWDYRDALTKSLLYFEAQRSGHLPYNQRVTWRGHSGLTDGLEQGVSLQFVFFLSSSFFWFYFIVLNCFVDISQNHLIKCDSFRFWHLILVSNNYSYLINSFERLILF